MADLFQGLNAQPDLFEGLTDVEAQNPAPKADPDRTARMAALVESNDVSQIEAQTEKLRLQIEAMGDDQIRTQAAARQQRMKIDSLIQIAGNPANDEERGLVAGARRAAQGVIQDGIEKRKEEALERLAVEKIQDLATSNPVQARVMLQTIENGNADERIADINAKRLILQREIEKAGIAKEQQTWISDVADFAMSVIPFNYSSGQVGNVDLPGVVKEWGDNIFAGRRRRSEASSLWNLPASEFSRVLREQVLPAVQENSTLLGYYDKSEQLNILSGLEDTPSVLENNAFNALDNFGLVPFTKAGSVAKSIPGLMVRNGARREAAGALARALEVAGTEGAEAATRKTGMASEEIANAVLPSSVNLEPSVKIPLTGETLMATDRAEALKAMLPTQLASDRFASKAEFDAAVEKTVKTIESEYTRPLVDYDVKEVPLASGSVARDVELTIGDLEGKAFKTKKAANAFLSGISDTGEVVRDQSGGWYIKMTRNMSETGMYTIRLNPVGTGDHLVDNILNARLVGDKLLADQAQRATNALNRNLAVVTKPLAETVNKLNVKEKAQLGEVLSLGRKEGRWFDDDTMDTLYERAYNRPMKKTEREAYQAYKDASDIEWMMRNDDVYLQKHLKGMNTVTFDAGQGLRVEGENAIVNRGLDNIGGSGRVYNITRGIHYNKNNPLTSEMVDQLKSEGYVLVSTERAFKLADGTTVKDFLMKAGDAKVQPLRRDQVAYRAGGHTMYEDKYYGRQTVKRLQPDTREEFLDNPNTYITGTKAEVDFWTSKMEQARLAYKEAENTSGAIDPEVLDDILEGTPLSGDQFIRNIETGVFEKETSFVTNFDRELPTDYIGSRFTSDGDDWLRTNGRMYYSSKGEDLPDFMGRQGKILDPYETLNKSLSNISNLSSFADYKQSAVERWVKTYGDYFDYKPGQSDMAVFGDAIPKRGVDQRIINKAQKQRELIKRTLSWRTEQDLKNEARTRRIVEWVNGSDPNGIRNDAARTLTNWFNNSNPVSALRGLAFDAKLGLFNVAQFPLQMSTMVAIITLSPKYGLEAMGNMIFLRQYLTKSGTEHYLDEVIKRGVHKLSGFSDPKEFKAFMKASKNSGFLDVGGTHGLINSYGPDATLSQIGSKANDFREKARFFFNEGEVWNRSVATHVAWKETKENFPGLAFDDPEFIRRWEGRAEEYAFNMSRESQAYWQRGVLSIPTQFWTYQVRMLEAMLGPTFTNEQKFRLIAGQTMLYGSAGLPFAGLISDEIKKRNGEAPAVDSFWGSLDRGMMDTVMYELTGADMAFGRRYASGNWITDLVRDIMGFSPYGEKSVAEFATGATGSTVFKAWGDGWAIMDKVIKYSTAEGGGDIGEPVTMDDWIRLASNISSINALHKAYLIDHLGVIQSSKGQTLYDNVPSAAAWETMLFGVEYGKTSDLSAKIGYLKDKKKLVQDASKVIEGYRVKMLNDPAKADEYAREINAYVRLLPPEIRQEAIKGVHKKLDKSLYEGITRQIEKERAKEQMIKDIQ